MDITYSEHAKRRLRQRGITEFEVEDVLRFPIRIKNSFEGQKVAIGESNNRIIVVVFVRKENYIKIITVM